MKNILVLSFLSAGLLLAGACDVYIEGRHDNMRWKYCNDNGAYEKGVNEGMNGNKMDSSWVHVCDSEDQPRLRAKFHDGFVAGLRGAPATLIISGARGWGSRCDFSSDCDVGLYCRYNRFGRSTCR